MSHLDIKRVKHTLEERQAHGKAPAPSVTPSKIDRLCCSSVKTFSVRRAESADDFWPGI